MKGTPRWAFRELPDKLTTREIDRPPFPPVHLAEHYVNVHEEQMIRERLARARGGRHPGSTEELKADLAWCRNAIETLDSGR